MHLTGDVLKWGDTVRVLTNYLNCIFYFHGNMNL